MRLVLMTDAWHPQINGVERTLGRIARLLRDRGDDVRIVHPALFRTLPCPTYPDLRLAIARPAAVARQIESVRPDFVHIATEGPLGWLARRHCLRTGQPFTTSYHTRFPEYVAARSPISKEGVSALLRRFHNAGAGCMVATQSLRAELAEQGFRRLVLWPRGVDTALFRPIPDACLDLPHPIFLNVSRMAVEKNLEAFLELDLPGSKVVVGDGPARASLEPRYPDAHFLGTRQGEDLARIYAAADVFVFPSLTDTFGNVVLEALACGTPVAAFPTTGPADILGDSKVGVLDADLRAGALTALDIDGASARDFALGWRWQDSVRIFRDNLFGARETQTLGGRAETGTTTGLALNRGGT